MKNHGGVIILMAEDDPDDCALMIEAFYETRSSGQLRTVKDGQELLDYLYNRGEYGISENAPKPHLIPLDLNLPVLDGHEVLVEIKADSILR